jgi:alkylated DNA repair dioxygenase AlkB
MAQHDNGRFILPPGLKLAFDVISPAQEVELLASCARYNLSYYAMDPKNPRSSVSFGFKYDFKDDNFTPCAPIPAEFEAVCAIAAEFAGVTPEEVIDCVVNHYEPGSMIQPHVDKPIFDLIIGLSLGSEVEMVFSKPEALGGDRIAVRLPPRSIYLMSGESRHLYRHELPHVPDTRWSITFRTLSPAGEALRAQFAQ